MATTATFRVLQFFLILASAFLGIVVGILLPRLNVAQRRATFVFWLALGINFLFFNLSFMIGGGFWTRIIFAFAMGFFAFAIKLLK